ncbi:hypothetical protein NL676_011513 [Syzygium grande]|nr:hypothetical protein NL676_011513 [Syzygium grande]
MVSSRAVHMDPENYLDPKKFDPSRWENIKAKAGAFLPFGAGSRDASTKETSLYKRPHYYYARSESTFIVESEVKIDGGDSSSECGGGGISVHRWPHLGSLHEGERVGVREQFGAAESFSAASGRNGLAFGRPDVGLLHGFQVRPSDSFLASFISRHGRTGIYKTFIFGGPSIIVCTPETCKRVLTDDQLFIPGYPKATLKLMGNRSFHGISPAEHKQL